MKLSDIGESGWVQRMRARVSSIPGRALVGIGDDASWISSPGSMLITCDLLIDEVHFLKELIPPRLLGRKSLAVNLSDIAGMAGVADYALLGLGLPRDIELKYLDDFLEGFLEMANEHKVELIGGDSCAGSVLTISVSVLGHPFSERPVLRSTAEAGDEIWLTGTIGDAGLGFEILKKCQRQELEIAQFHHSSLALRHFDPAPRLKVGERLAGLAKAMIDLSDGLTVDLGHILEESSKEQPLQAIVELEKIPLSEDFKKYYEGKPLESEEGFRIALSGGEDYELLFCAEQGSGGEIIKIGKELGLAVSKIGRIEPGEVPEIILLDEKGSQVPVPAVWFEHFPKEPQIPKG